MSTTILYVHVNIPLDFGITSENATALGQSECTLSTSMELFFLKVMKIIITYPKGRALMQIYRVVPQTKRGNKCFSGLVTICKWFSKDGFKCWRSNHSLIEAVSYERHKQMVPVISLFGTQH